MTAENSSQAKRPAARRRKPSSKPSSSKSPAPKARPEKRGEVAGKGISAGAAAEASATPEQVAPPPRQAAPRASEHSAPRPGLTGRAPGELWSRPYIRNNLRPEDDFGLDPSFEGRVQPLLEGLYRSYFRVTVEGASHVPNEGGALLVANHGGTLPWDGLMLRTALRQEHPTGRPVRWLCEDVLYYMPFVGTWLSRLGAVRACQENGRRLLEEQNVVAVFPEGVKGLGRLYRNRYELERFGRGGFIKLALRAQVPVIPVGIVGAEDAHPLLWKLPGGKRTGLPYVPVTPTFPMLGLAGLAPLPARWHIEIGAPISMESYEPSAAQDAVVVGRLSEKVRSSVERLVQRGLERRGDPYPFRLPFLSR